ncbi:transcriptional regulator [Curtobacterium sp. 'Ferrero']|uniref:transcriptional regulator n=1 Tax=Curtobacterium sp. 'Ferrero' TaxID=2033654 RepID=UPI000BD8C649|nr:transcriptional regulator [Curtobacterium sp. 'Ferrero']PCN48961.1 transcriptional regulator [Curtobacterium sp. 'Ferrero']
MNDIDMEQQDRIAAEDRVEAAARVRRGYLQIRASFVQKAFGDDRASTLATLVQARQPRALLLYLMLLYVWPWLKDENEPLEATAWMNLLHSRLSVDDRDAQSLTWSESTLSRTWRYLEKQQLVTKTRGKRSRLLVKPLREDRSGAYEAPSGEKENWDEVYFTIPDRFWLGEDFARLSTPGLAMLLVIAKETNRKKEFRATFDQFAAWYGFSRSTVAAGISELRDAGMLVERIEWIDARLSKIRKTKEVHYSLAGPYSTAARNTAKRNADRRRQRAAKEPSQQSRRRTPRFSGSTQTKGRTGVTKRR